MKKANPGDGLANSKSLYECSNALKVAQTSLKNNSTCSRECRRTSPAIAARNGRNMAKATLSLKGDSNTSQKVFDELRGQLCSMCQANFTKAYWKEIEGLDAE